ncbi:phosphatidylinositol-specific phospholipase C/glycerophosphodiester phosphodiesterase family protein [Neptunicella sp. SCSIO 80796]|uniref:phosphatidylinositol-specific phospholipase C/glycerophosphodiester phosphodiesterase family protein n=1 Tax=Neptunicella plasticusilytica TaxID=3117012 RepID=UPI003A4D3E2F
MIRNKFRVSCCVAIVTILLNWSLQAQPLYQAHAHNDYAHPRPLLDALEQGFNSVEADVFLQDGQLLVGHQTADLTPQRNLRVLYLDPLWSRYTAFQHKIYPDSRQPFILLIDFKSTGERLYPVLQQLLKAYQPMLTGVQDGVLVESAVTIIISGDVPRDMIIANKQRHVFIDGRLKDLGSHYRPTDMPLISASWKEHFSWNGEGAIPDKERQKLQTLVKQSHQQGRLLRFWATPDNLQAWQLLQQSGVDLINTDNLRGLSHFLTTSSP